MQGSRGYVSLLGHLAIWLPRWCPELANRLGILGRSFGRKRGLYKPLTDSLHYIVFGRFSRWLYLGSRLGEMAQPWELASGPRGYSLLRDSAYYEVQDGTARNGLGTRPQDFHRRRAQRSHSRACSVAEFDEHLGGGAKSRGPKTATSGHCYFTLKDQDAQLRCVCFRQSLRYLKFKPQDGMAVLARGHIDVYEARGEYQLLVESHRAAGPWRPPIRLLNNSRRNWRPRACSTPRANAPSPVYRGASASSHRLPARRWFAISPKSCLRRFPGLSLAYLPRAGAGRWIGGSRCERAIEYFNNSGWADVVDCGARRCDRSRIFGHSTKRRFARAIAGSSVPVISAVGHETDFTIADFVADLRAATPSAAAELVICPRDQLFDQLAVHDHKLLQTVRYRLATAARALHERGVERASAVLHRNVGRWQQRVDELDYRYRLRGRVVGVASGRRRNLDELTGRLSRLDLRLRFAQTRRRLETASVAATQLIRLRLTRAHGSLEPLMAHLTQLSPLKILDRGYAIVTNEGGGIVKQPADAPVDSGVRIRLAQGEIAARVLKRE